MRIPSEEMVAILLQFADKKDKMWEFRLPKDENFIEKYFTKKLIFLNLE